MWLMSGLVPWMSQSRDKAQRELLNRSKGLRNFYMCTLYTPLERCAQLRYCPRPLSSCGKSSSKDNCLQGYAAGAASYSLSLSLSLSLPRCGIDSALANWGTGLIDIDIAAAAPSPSAARVAQTICVQKSNCFVCFVFFANDFNLYSHSYLYLYLN